MTAMVPQAGAAGSAGGLFGQYAAPAATALQAGGALVSGLSQSSALRANARTYDTEAGIASTQGYEQEAQQRRAGSMEMGRETAAVGAAGAGYGGSAGRALAQSAQNTELDALNIRYKAQLQKWAYGAQAENLRSEASTATASGVMKAGAALLSGHSKNYLSPGVS